MYIEPGIRYRAVLARYKADVELRDEHFKSLQEEQNALDRLKDECAQLELSIKVSMMYADTSHRSVVKDVRMIRRMELRYPFLVNTEIDVEEVL